MNDIGRCSAKGAESWLVKWAQWKTTNLWSSSVCLTAAHQLQLLSAIPNHCECCNLGVIKNRSMRLFTDSLCTRLLGVLVSYKETDKKSKTFSLSSVSLPPKILYWLQCQLIPDQVTYVVTVSLPLCELHPHDILLRHPQRDIGASDYWKSSQSSLPEQKEACGLLGLTKQ